MAVCEYCGCREIPLIGRLSEEHYQAVDALGVLRRAIESSDAVAVGSAVVALREELITHNESEEAGLFLELGRDEYFAPTIAELLEQHVQFRVLLDRIAGGDWAAYDELEDTLRHHIDREENGLFPATAVAVDGDVWTEIDRLTHAFNHERGREHGHTEAEALQARRGDAGHRKSPAGDEDSTVTKQADERGHTATHTRAPAPRGRRDPVVELAEGFVLRPAKLDDAASLFALWTQAGLHVGRPESVVEDLAGVLALHPQLVLVAVAGDSIVGSVLGTWDGRRGWINRLATRPDWQGRGVASALLTAVEDGVRALGGGKVNLLIEADNYDVVSYYEGRGYATDDLIFMEKYL